MRGTKSNRRFWTLTLSLAVLMSGASAVRAQSQFVSEEASRELAEVSTDLHGLLANLKRFPDGVKLTATSDGKQQFWSLPTPLETRIHRLYKELRVGAKYPLLMRDDDGKSLYRAVQPLIGSFCSTDGISASKGEQAAMANLQERIGDVESTLANLHGRLQRDISRARWSMVSQAVAKR